MHNFYNSTSLLVDDEQKLHTSHEKRKLLQQHSQQEHESLADRWLTRRATVCACLIVSLMLLVTSVKAQNVLEGSQSILQLSPNYLHIDINDDVVTVKARDVTIRDLLTEIAHRTDLALVLYHPLDERVTMEVDGLSLPEVLVRILNHKNFALQYARSLSRTRDSGRQRVNRLWVLPGRPGEYRQRGHVAKQFSSENTSAVEVPPAEPLNTDARLRRPAVNDLQELDRDEANLSLALADEDAKVRVKAVYALAEVGGDQAVAALVGALGDENARVRAEAARALGEIGSDRAIEILEQPFHDADKRVRQAAIEAFTDIGGTQSAHALAVALQDPDTSLRKGAVVALGQIGGLAATQILQQAFKDAENKVRVAAIDALTDIGGDEAARALANALHHEDVALRVLALQALSEIGGDTAVALVRQASDNPDPTIRQAAVGVLAELLDKRR